MGWRPTHRLAAALLGCALMVGLLLVAPANGRPTPDRRAATPGVATVASSADVGDVLDYWTPARMARAKPLGLDVDGNRLAPRPRATGRTTARATVAVPRSAGKLFFTTPQGDAVCSAAAVNTAQRDVIITAAHCAHTGPGFLLTPASYYTNFLFVPRYNNGSAPDGAWVGVRAITHRQWIEDEDLAYDQALIEVAPRGGANLVDVVGGNGLAWNYPARQSDVRVWGWPAEAPYNGETAHRCAGSTSSFAGTADAKIACPMTGGASGGPWFLSMTGAHVGFIWAVTSRRTVTGEKYLIARPLTSAIQTLLAAAARTSGPVATRPASARAAQRPRVALRAIPARVGSGQLLRLRVRTTRGTRVVLRVRTSRSAPWTRSRVGRTNSDGLVEFRLRPAKPERRWYRAYTARAASDPVRVSVHRCPLPYDRSAAVVDAIRCTRPVG